MMQNHVIYSDDPQAVEKLQAKLDKLTAMHAHMKEINAYFRKHATALGCPGLSDEDAAKLDRRVQEGYSWEKQPYTHQAKKQDGCSSKEQPFFLGRQRMGRGSICPRP